MNKQQQMQDILEDTIEHYSDDPCETRAADEMKKRGLFDESVATVHEGVSNYMELINKQKGKTNENK